MPTVEHPPTPISAEWRQHRRLAKRYYLPLRVRLAALYVGTLALAGSVVITSRLVGIRHDIPQTLADYVAGPIFALAFLIIGVLCWYMIFYANYLISPVGFEFRLIPYALFAPWENITVVTGVSGAEVPVAVEFHPPQFETHWFTRYMRWIELDQESPIHHCLCTDRAASRATLDYARHVEPLASRRSQGRW